VFEKILGIRKIKKASKGIACQYTKNKDSFMEATKKSYPTDLTDNQWKLINDLISAAGTGGRKRTIAVMVSCCQCRKRSYALYRMY
jgi:hypothetical protein